MENISVSFWLNQEWDTKEKSWHKALCGSFHDCVKQGGGAALDDPKWVSVKHWNNFTVKQHSTMSSWVIIATFTPRDPNKQKLKPWWRCGGNDYRAIWNVKCAYKDWTQLTIHLPVWLNSWSVCCGPLPVIHARELWLKRGVQDTQVNFRSTFSLETAQLRNTRDMCSWPSWIPERCNRVSDVAPSLLGKEQDTETWLTAGKILFIMVFC